MGVGIYDTEREEVGSGRQEVIVLLMTSAGFLECSGGPEMAFVCVVCLVASVISMTEDSLQPLWTIAHQAPLSMKFPREEYWNGLPFPSPGYLPNPGIHSFMLHFLSYRQILYN